MKRPKGLLSVNIDLVDESNDNNNNYGEQQLSFQLDDDTHIYRQNGVSIGVDYLRLEGKTYERGALFSGALTHDGHSQIIGQGAFSTVYKSIWTHHPSKSNSSNIGSSYDETKATTVTTTTPVAIKELRIFESSAERRKMLLHELKALSRLSTCPALVQLYGAFLSPSSGGGADGNGHIHYDNHYHHDSHTITVVLEYMDLGSLDLLIYNSHTNNSNNLSLSRSNDYSSHHDEEKKEESSVSAEFSSPSSRNHQMLPMPAIASIAYQTLVGLTALHQHRTLHRDIKPSNVLVCRSGCVKLCDFGLATLGEQSMNTTVLGTTKYMSPERLAGQAYGRPSDLWSFGLLLLECITGQPPFSEISSIVDLLVTLQDQEVDFRQILATKDLEVGLVEMILGSLQLEPAKRIPANILLESPWFRKVHQIQNMDDAHHRLRQQLQLINPESS